MSNIDHPQHYNQLPNGIECIDVIEHFNLNRGNALKYIWRAGYKGNEVEDLEKAIWYLQREIERIKKHMIPSYVCMNCHQYIVGRCNIYAENDPETFYCPSFEWHQEDEQSSGKHCEMYRSCPYRSLWGDETVKVHHCPKCDDVLLAAESYGLYCENCDWAYFCDDTRCVSLACKNCDGYLSECCDAYKGQNIDLFSCPKFVIGNFNNESRCLQCQHFSTTDCPYDAATARNCSAVCGIFKQIAMGA